jgi:nuclear GTP-binding protein
MKRHGGKGGSGGVNGDGSGGYPTQVGAAGVVRRPSSASAQGDAGPRAGLLRRADKTVLHDKHRASAVPAAARALLERPEAGAGPGVHRLPDRQEQAQVSYLPPARAASRERGPAGDTGEKRSPRDAWEWHAGPAEKDSSQRAYTGSLNRILERADVLLEVLDARDPDGCRTRKVEEYIQSNRPEVLLVLVLNKIDLVPPNVTAAWVRHLKADYPVVLFKSGTRLHRGDTIAHAKTRAAGATQKQLGTGDCVGGEELLQVLKKLCQSHAGFGGKTKISVAVVGQPNVGKSSLINSLVRQKVAFTGDRPGITKTLQTLHLDKDIILFDTPGVVVESAAEGFSSEAQLALRNCVPADKISNFVAVVDLMLQRCDKRVLMEHYGIESEVHTASHLLRAIAQKRGKLLRGGEPDEDSAARALLKDWNSGALKYYMMPPAVDHSRILETSVVTEFAKEFNIDDM